MVFLELLPSQYHQRIYYCLPSPTADPNNLHTRDLRLGVDTPTQASNTPPMQDKDSATPEVFRTEMHDESSTAQPLDYSKTKVPVYDKGRLSYCMTMSFGL